VHVAEVSSFMAAHLRYLDPELSLADQDRYYAETALVAERLGAANVPTSRRAIEDYLARMRPQLECGERTLEVLRLLKDAPAPSRMAKPMGNLMMQAGIELLPAWASAMFGIRQTTLKRKMIRAGINRSAPVLRWAVRNASIHRAKRRMGIV
jgi:uncharacterized protein (DUF2236 family)